MLPWETSYGNKCKETKFSCSGKLLPLEKSPYSPRRLHFLRKWQHYEMLQSMCPQRNGEHLFTYIILCEKLFIGWETKFRQLFSFSWEVLKYTYIHFTTGHNFGIIRILQTEQKPKDMHFFYSCSLFMHSTVQMWMCPHAIGKKSI